MAKHTSSKNDPDLEVPVVKVQDEPYNYSVVQIESMIDAHLVYTGQVSGKQYEWTKAGSIQLVDERDAPALLSKRIGERSCCGEGLQGNLVFQQTK